jgi:hypothetical protein
MYTFFLYKVTHIGSYTQLHTNLAALEASPEIFFYSVLNNSAVFSISLT